jgi:hypothetical protein
VQSGILNNSFDIESQKSYNVVTIALKEKEGDGKIQTCQLNLSTLQEKKVVHIVCAVRYKLFLEV